MQVISKGVCALGVILFLLGGSARAQDNPTISEPATESGSSAAVTAAPGASAGSPSVAKGFVRVRLHDGTIQDVHKPTFHEVADRKFWITVAASYATSVLDIEGEQHCASVHPNCLESNPLLGSTRLQQYGVKMPINALFVWGLYRYKRSQMIQHESGAHDHMPNWLIIGNTWTALNVATSIHNWRLAAAACPSGTSCSAPATQSPAH